MFVELKDIDLDVMRIVRVDNIIECRGSDYGTTVYLSFDDGRSDYFTTSRSTRDIMDQIQG